jgi:hypothetical protein
VVYQVSKCDWPAGTVVAPETNPRERLDAVVSGLLRITIEEESAILAAGDMVVCPTRRGSKRSSRRPFTGVVFHRRLSGPSAQKR